MENTDQALNLVDRMPAPTGDWCCIDVPEFDAMRIEPVRKPVKKYTAKLHARSVAKELGMKSGLVYLPGQPEIKYEDSDQPLPFRQRRYFYYMSGISYPGCFLTYHIERDTLSLFIPPPHPMSSVIFDGQVPTREFFMQKSDVDDVLWTTDMQQYISFWAHHEKGRIYVLHPSQVPELPPDAKLSSSLIETELLRPAMDSARAIKSPYEVTMIRKANAITAKAHTTVLRSLCRLKNETEVAAIFVATCAGHKATKQAFEVEVGSGPNAATLNYSANNASLEGKQLLCLDGGCEWDCYASDVARVFPISGEWTTEAKQIQDLVTKMQEECMAMVQPGADYSKIHLHAHQVAVRGLMDIGLLHKGTFEEIYMSGASVAFFPGDLGHYMGLEVHDRGKSSRGLSLHNTIQQIQSEPDASLTSFHMARQLTKTGTASPSILETGNVITVEPGIYFHQEMFEKIHCHNPRFKKYINAPLLEKYYPVGGVRIEDDLLVTENGYENLTTAVKGDEMLRIIKEGWSRKDDRGGAENGARRSKGG